MSPGMIGFFFLEKHACWSVINGRRLTLKPGDLQIVRSGAELSMGHDPAQPITALSLTLSVAQGTVPNVLLQREFARRYKIRNPRRLIAGFDAILDALEQPPSFRDWSVTGALLQWLVTVLEETAAPLSVEPDLDESVVNRVLHSQAWVNARLGSVITLADWAKAAGWHPVHFERVFKRETGLAPMRWLEERRMEAARQYLCATRRRVREIAEAVGYPDPFYFSRVFRKTYGHPPLRYRKLGAEFSILR